MWQQIHSIGMGHPDISRGCNASKTFQNTERALESFSKPLYSYTLTHTQGVYERTQYRVNQRMVDSLLAQPT